MYTLIYYHCIVHFTSLMQTSTWPLLCWWYEDNAACSMFNFLQNFSNKLLPVSNIILLGKPYSWKKIILYASIRLFTDRFFCLQHYRELAVIVYNANIILIMQTRYIWSNHFRWLFGNFMVLYSFLWLSMLKIPIYGWYGVAVALGSVMYPVSLCLCLLGWICQLLPCHFKMSSMARGSVLYCLCSLVIILQCILSAVVNDCLELFCVVIHISSYILGCL